MKTLRVGVFETNSSSEHLICFPCASAYANLHVDPCTVTAHGEGSYDWGYEVLDQTWQLVDYWLVAIKMNGNWADVYVHCCTPGNRSKRSARKGPPYQPSSSDIQVMPICSALM